MRVLVEYRIYINKSYEKINIVYKSYRKLIRRYIWENSRCQILEETQNPSRDTF